MTVARDSYALTLWTWWHLIQQDRRAWIDAKLDRFDLAGMIAHAQHEPKKLGEQYEQFLSEILVSPGAASNPEVRNERLKKMLADHAKLIPIPAQ
jgi:hypothetical protein